MHRLAAIAAVIHAICLCSSPVAAQSARDRIEVVYRPDVMFYSIENGGQARFRLEEDEDWTFTVSRRDYARIRGLLESYRADGVVCDDPEASPYREGFLIWKDRHGELRRPNDTLCYSDAFARRTRNLEQAYRLMEDWARARWTPPPGLAAPTSMTMIWRSWDQTLVEWTIPRGGEGRYVSGDADPVAFTVSTEQFDRFRGLFRPYEGVRFECRRIITDGAYGSVIWTQPGHADQSLNFDAGCVSGDASDVFQRLEDAEVMLNGFRGAH